MIGNGRIDGIGPCNAWDGWLDRCFLAGGEDGVVDEKVRGESGGREGLNT